MIREAEPASLVVPNTVSRHYDKLYKKQSHRCTNDKTYRGVLCSMNLAVVFRAPPLGGCIWASKLVSPRKDPPSEGVGRAYAGLLRKVCVRVPDCPPGAAYYAQTAGDSVGAPAGTVHFGELLSILFHRPGPHHCARADPVRLCRTPEHRGERETMVTSRGITTSASYTKKKCVSPMARLEDVRFAHSVHKSSSIHLAPCYFK
jgi:hypothetical protein